MIFPPNYSYFAVPHFSPNIFNFYLIFLECLLQINRQLIKEILINFQSFNLTRWAAFQQDLQLNIFLSFIYLHSNWCRGTQELLPHRTHFFRSAESCCLSDSSLRIDQPQKEGLRAFYRINSDCAVSHWGWKTWLLNILLVALTCDKSSPHGFNGITWQALAML